MSNPSSIRLLLSALLLAAAIGALPAGAAAQDKEQKEVLRELLAAQDRELEEMARRFVSVVIPAADRDFAGLKGAELPKDAPSDLRYAARFSGPEGWRTEIRTNYMGASFSCYFLTWDSSLPKLWFYAKDGGNALKPMYKTIRGVLNELLKSGWKRKSKEDRRWSKDYPATGSSATWTRQDGLYVILSRTEHWDPDKDYDNKFKGKLLKDIDPSFLPTLHLSLTVYKHKGH